MRTTRELDPAGLHAANQLAELHGVSAATVVSDLVVAS
jgi:hypothetical protein